MENIEIYTDGSCKGNPGPGGWAAILLKEDSDQPFTVLFGNTTDTTNNRMEMMAVIEALRYVENKGLNGQKIQLYTDSNLIVQTINQGWKKKKNTDLWKEMDRLLEGIKITFTWVKGHANNRWNIEVDKIALSEAEKAAKR